MPVLAATGDAEIFARPVAVAASESANSLQAPPHIFMAILGVGLVAFAVSRRLRKSRA